MEMMQHLLIGAKGSAVGIPRVWLKIEKVFVRVARRQVKLLDRDASLAQTFCTNGCNKLLDHLTVREPVSMEDNLDVNTDVAEPMGTPEEMQMVKHKVLEVPVTSG